MLKKSEKVDFAFEIHTPDLLDTRNQEGRRVTPVGIPPHGAHGASLMMFYE